MAIPGETVGAGTIICECGEPMPLQVCRSAAGYYLGHFCWSCGPYSRESGYYQTPEAAQAALDSGRFGR